ncbi:hypothetical protein AMTRI_Chr06g174290 [Amborella trichopoda]
MRNFIWIGNHELSKRITVSWDKVCKPINGGGLGLRRLKDVNFSILMKLAWNVFYKKAIWSKFIFANISRRMLLGGWMIGNGSSIDFWKDVWIRNTSLASLSGLPLSAFKNSNARVSHVILGNPQTWCFPMVNSALLNKFLTDASANDLPHAPILDQRILKHTISVSLMSWKATNNAIAIDEKIRLIGIPLVSCCSLCGKSMETRDHLFVTCLFANSMWSWFSKLFGLPLPCDIPEYHGRMRDLWIIEWSHIITAIWMSRNKCRFDDGQPMSQIQCDPPILEVVWLPPMPGCVKLNIDGFMLGSFSRPIPMGTNYPAKLNAFIYGAEYVIKKGFTNVRIECDSFGIILATRSRLLPWCIQTKWENVIASLNNISWKISNVYREANTAIDKMANIGCHMTSYQEWDTHPNSVGHHISWDAAGRPRYRFK